MAEMPVRPGPSFGGITRIRFKGFDRHFSPIISATRLPRTNFSVRLRPASAKSIRWIEPSLARCCFYAPAAPFAASPDGAAEPPKDWRSCKWSAGCT